MSGSAPSESVTPAPAAPLPVALLSDADGQELAWLAAETVRRTLAGVSTDGLVPSAPALHLPGCSFVTLENQGALRGCIGTLEPRRPLYRDVIANARHAMTDPRLAPVTRDEWPSLRVSVSVLGPAEPVRATCFSQLRDLLRPYVDGLTITVGHRRATFLPAVWHKLPEPDDFLAALLAKGGWPRDRLPDQAKVCRYVASEFQHAGPYVPL